MAIVSNRSDLHTDALPTDAGPRRSLASFHIYAGITALLGVDLLVFGDWIAAQAIAAPMLASSLDFGLYARGVGIACLLTAAVVTLTARRGGDWLLVGPAIAGTAGAVCIAAALLGAGVLSPLGIALLLGLGAMDVVFALLMRRGLTAE